MTDISPISMILIITRKLGIEGYAAFFKFLHFIMDFNLYSLTRFSNEGNQRSPMYYDILICRYFIYYRILQIYK